MGDVMGMGLNDMQLRFCHEYMVDMNATQAGLRAGYNKGSGRRLAKRPEVKAYIAGLQTRALQRTDITAERVLEEYARIAFFDIRKVFGADGRLLPVAELDAVAAAAIASIESFEADGGETPDGERIRGTVRKVRAADKLRALDSLGRHLGIFGIDNAQSRAEVVIKTVSFE